MQVYDSTSATTGANTYLEKKDVTYLQEYVPSTESSKRGKPKYYAMFGAATGDGDTNSGVYIYLQHQIVPTNLECIIIKCQLLWPRITPLIILV